MATKSGIKRVKPPEELVSGVARQIKALEKQAVLEDPWMLADMVALRDEMDAAIVRVVAAKRAADPPTRWADLAFNLGISELTALKRYKRRIDALGE